MPERIVDFLEMVEIEQHHGDLPAAPARSRQGTGQPVPEQHAIRQAGQRIVQREMAHLLLRRLALGDIHRRADRADDLALRVAYRRRARQLVVEGAVVEPDPQLVVAHQLATRRALQRQPVGRHLHPVPIDPEVARPLRRRRRQREIVARRQPKLLRSVLVAADAPRVAVVRKPHGDRDRFHHGLELRRTRLEGDLGPPPLGDVAEHDLDGQPPIDGHRGGRGFDHEWRAVQAAIGELGGFHPVARRPQSRRFVPAPMRMLSSATRSKIVRPTRAAASSAPNSSAACRLARMILPSAWAKTASGPVSTSAR